MREPLKFITDEKSLKFYLIDCGSGLMHLIVFPNDKVMLFDCNVTSDNEDRIIKFLEKHIPSKWDNETGEFKKEIDIFVNSHRDIDHLRGLKKVNSNFKVKSIWDSGQTGASTDNSEYNYYMYLRRELKKANENNLFVPVPSNEAIRHDIDDIDIYCLSAEADFQEDYVNEVKMAVKKQHTNSMVLLIKYGERKMLLTGDSDWKSWKEQIVPNFKWNSVNYENTDILVASHHGSRSFFTDELNETIDVEKNPDTTYLESIGLIKPVVTIISCGDYEEYHHPNKEALALYKTHTSNEQVYTTNELGTICGFISATGDFSIIPDRFKNNENQENYNFKLSCNVNGVSINNGDSLATGCNLKFSALVTQGLRTPDDKLKIFWEVSNMGIDDDYEHQEIYYKGKKEESGKYVFERELSFVGIHTLRCRIKNTSKGIDETKIFIVRGI
ncbi:beta-lactamase superfamily II metal-dependent hydrolase [Breznakia blatticola]|uniref:Beta-lactamase superfamily II metal-dependent hydrolase n=1 Tax=Breznakia blatticola TaxID=1754012 RepID=A0A4R7ZCN3_9FIRM|nr:MBL fold metallo-hydrolase [Breznakia blatticola]TDW13224.1 beta-lactamase superfamily II metal-dependent hydrolase [Breznakia blatticola]